MRFGVKALTLDPQVRGRAAIRLTRPHDNISPEHDSGSFVFAGFVFTWVISECLGERTLTLDVDEDLLINGGTHASTR